MLYKSLLAVWLLCSVALAEKARYDNYRVVKVQIQNSLQQAAMQQIEQFPDGYRFWEPITNVGTTIVVPPHKFSEFANLVERLEFKTTLVSNNMQELIDNEQPKVMPKSNFGWSAFYDHDAIINWMESLTVSYPDIVTSFSIGQTYEGRDLRGYKISYKEGNPGVFVESGMIGREWAAVSTVTFMVNELLTSTDHHIRETAENFDWYLVPIANPDGYVYSWTDDRMWRKTRSLTGGCYGADGNRNFDHMWMRGGSSNIQCLETFAGTAPFSEIETRSISEYYKTIASDVFVYLSFHAVRQNLLVPFGWTSGHIGNYFESIAIARKAVGELRKRHGTVYNYGNIVERTNLASGASIDWAMGEQGTQFAYLYELRDLGEFGSLLPADQIIPTAEETLDSVMVLLREAKKKIHH